MQVKTAQDPSVIGRRSTHLQVRQSVFVFLLGSTVGFGPVNSSVRGGIAVAYAALVIIAGDQSGLARLETTLCDSTRGVWVPGPGLEVSGAGPPGHNVGHKDVGVAKARLRRVGPLGFEIT